MKVISVMQPTRIGIWLRFALLILIAASCTVYSPVAGILASLGIVVALYDPALLMPFGVAALVWLPMRGIFSARAAELSSTAVMASNIGTGDPVRQVTILSLFAIGLLLLLRVRFKIGGSAALRCFSLYVFLGLLSEIWSADPALTARRITSAISCTVFTAGMAVGYYGQRRDGGSLLVRHICVLGALACVAVMMVGVAAGDFHVLDVGWRLGSDGRENQISWVAALALLGVWVTRGNRKIWPASWVANGILAVSGTALLLSKSRTTLIAAGVGLLACELLNARSKRRIAGLALAATLLLALGSSSGFGELWRRGGSEAELHTISGRTMLWQSVWRDVWTQPWLGHGYGAYWTADRVNRQMVEWAATSAHNGYLDIAAQLGLTGLVIMLAFLGICGSNARRLMSLDKSKRDIGVLLLAVIASFLVINTTESYADALEYFPLLATLTLAFYVSYVCRKTPVLTASSSSSLRRLDEVPRRPRNLTNVSARVNQKIARWDPL